MASPIRPINAGRVEHDVVAEGRDRRNRMDAALIERTYLSVIADLRASDFAAPFRLSIAPQRCHIEELRAITARLPSTGRVLDIGTGMGIVPETLLRLGHSVVAVDIAAGEADSGSLQRLKSLGVEGHFAWVGEEQIPIPDESIDVAFAGDVIEHLPTTPKWFLLELMRTLKPGGYIVITTPNAVRLTVRLRVLLGYSNWPPVSQYIDLGQDWRYHMGHHKEYSGPELGGVLRHCGLSDVAVTYFEDNLRRKGIVRSAKDIATQDRFMSKYWKDQQPPFSIGEIVRLAMLGVVNAISTLRSSFLAVGQKPIGS
jgi:2-polyprenyl-3-methyl-5-hydroxy-6-metoxy-1,4-benzoquinol methylase